MGKIISMATTDFTKPNYFINRELSWLAFNERVLEEAEDASQPLLERLKFLCIFSSNLDEFFEVRVAGIKQQIENGVEQAAADGMDPEEIFVAIQKRAHELVARQYKCWNQTIRPLIVKENIVFSTFPDLSAADKKWLHTYFQNEVFPVLTPLAVDSSHPFPQLQNKSHNLIVKLRKPGKGNEERLAIVQIPRVLTRLVRIPRESDPSRFEYIFLKSVIKEFVGDLFPGLEVISGHAFRITRNSDLYIEDEDAENLLHAIEQELLKRNKGNAVKLEVQSDCPEDVATFLLATFKLTKHDLYTVEGPTSFLHLMPLVGLEPFSRLRDRPYSPVCDPALPADADPFETMRRRDILLHHPYETFDSVVDFIERASEDPHVLGIKMTLYRTSGDSPIVKALMEAARNGKQVTVLVELKARFDEANNINWARQLEDAGCHVLYGIVGLKVHSKVLLVVRHDGDRIRHYVHLGTGNYHPRTARLYTDLSLFTTNEAICREVAALFNAITGMGEAPVFKKLLVAPFDMARKFKEMVEAEAKAAKEGKEARIIAKVNSLVDEELIKALYAASCAGVKIDLIVRGICCLRPGIKGVSENIRVVSIVGRFLEHSRIFYFHNSGEPLIYLGSADWMPRNLIRRIEVIFPVEDSVLRKELVDFILPTFLSDEVKSRVLQPDGTYTRSKPSTKSKPKQAQLAFREHAREQAERIRKAARETTPEIVVKKHP